MSTVFIEEKVRVPDWVEDLTSFRQWAHSPEYPERGKISYLKDEVWVDMSKEHYGLHGTPEPSAIGRSESHGCIRLTNWDATRLARLVSPGTKLILK